MINGVKSKNNLLMLVSILKTKPKRHALQMSGINFSHRKSQDIFFQTVFVLTSISRFNGVYQCTTMTIWKDISNAYENYKLRLIFLKLNICFILLNTWFYYTHTWQVIPECPLLMFIMLLYDFNEITLAHYFESYQH